MKKSFTSHRLNLELRSESTFALIEVQAIAIVIWWFDEFTSFGESRPQAKF
jgi:hypothetical protein